MKAKKEPEAVAAERRDVDSVTHELEAALAEIDRLRLKQAEAVRIFRSALMKSDEARPKCKVVKTDRHTGRDIPHGGDYVIVKKTPSGMLVVRPAGDPDAPTVKYKWVERRGQYVETEKVNMWSSPRCLKDVPAEFMPAEGSKE